MGRNQNGLGTYIKLTNGNWQNKIMCQQKTELGKNKFVTGQGSTKKIAHEIAIKRKKEYDKIRSAGQTIDKDKKESTLNDLMVSWFEIHSVESQWSSNTKITRKKNIENMLLSKIGSVKVKMIDTNILNKVFMEMLENYGRQNVGMVYSLTLQFFEYCKIQFIIEDNPCTNMMKLPKKKKIKEYSNINDFEEEKDNYKIFTEDEINKIKDICIFYDTTKDMSIRLVAPRAAIFVVMFLTGMRGQEIRALRLQDINFNSHTIKINKALSIDEKGATISKQPKTKNSNRIIGINEETEKYIKIIIDNRLNKDTDLLCPTKNGTWMDRRNFSRLFDNILDKCVIDKNGRSPHNLRHTFVSFAIEKNNMSPLKNKEMLFISKYAGHADLTTTLNIYTHLQDSKLKDVGYTDEITIQEINVSFE